jgi:hypothetical protein
VNHSLLTADRATHLKVVGLALLSATVAAVVGMDARTHNHSLPVVSFPTPSIHVAKSGAGESVRYVAESDSRHSNRLLRSV